ncbi:MAG: DUF4347 domain-containing protein, partial [Magnetococcus sp. DMHC-6]
MDSFWNKSFKRPVSKAVRTRNVKPVLMALEPRLMFDGAAGVDVVDHVSDSTAHTVPDDAAQALIPNAPAPVQVRAVDTTLNDGKKEVVFVDTSVADYKTLEAGIHAGVEIEEIDGSQDGLAQIAQWAETHNGYDAIHVLSHGAEGTLYVGTTTLTDASLTDSVVQTELAMIGHSLNESGDILLYGCDIAKGVDGALFISGLATATGADVAASLDSTGTTTLDGNWTLEANTGTINIADIQFDNSYNYILAVDTKTYNGTLTTAASFNRPWTTEDINSGNDYHPTTYTGAQVTQTSVSSFNYVAFNFTPVEGGSFTLETTNVVIGEYNDSMLFIYQNSFNAASPLTNLYYVNDDYGTELRSMISDITLNSGTTYIGVITTFTAGDTGSFTFKITGPSASGMTVSAGVPVAAPTVTLSVNNTTIAESAGTSTVTATLSAAAASNTNVTIAASGTATDSGTDYTLSSTTITILAGSTTGTATITAVQDTLDEVDETVIVDITGVSGGGGATESGTQQQTVTITDDDAAPTVTLSVNNASIAEAAGTSTVTATLSAISSKTVTVTLSPTGTATGGGTDYSLASTTITINAGSLTGTTTVTAVQDATVEGSETVILDITGVSNGTESGTQQQTVTILDDDNAAPTVSAGSATFTLIEAGGVANATSGISSSSITLSKADADGTASYDTAWMASNGWSTSNGGVTYSKTGTYGVATLTVATNIVSYALNNSDMDTQALTNGQSVNDTFTVRVTDGTDTASTNAIFSITGANDTPTVSAGSATATLVEAGGVSNGTSGTSSSSITLTKSDVDGTASYDTTWMASNGWSTSNGGTTYTQTGTYGTAILTVATGVVSYTLTDSDTDTETLTSGQSVTDSFTVRVTDGSATQSVSASFAITGANDAPLFFGLDGDSGTFVAGGTPEYIDDQVTVEVVATITDIDSTHFNGGYVTITQNSGTANGTFSLDNTAILSGTGTVAFNGTLGGSGADSILTAGETVWVNSLITSSGSGWVAIGTVDSTEDGQGGNNLKITFNTTDATPDTVGILAQYLKYTAPTTGARVFGVVVNDGNGGSSAAASVTMTGSSAPPVITIANSNLSYTENTTATQIDATATVIDNDGNSEWDGGSLKAQITANNEAADEISIADTNGTGPAITISGTTILADGTNVGSLSTSGGIVTNDTALTVTFDSNATNAIVQEVLQSLRYRNTSETPGTSNRTITITATDKNAEAGVDTRTVAVNSVADVTSVAITNGTRNGNTAYRLDDIVVVTVNFDQSVTVTGTPTLALDIGGSSKTATYVNGSPGTALVFNYTVQAGDLDTNGVDATLNGIALPGGATIIDTTGTADNATLTYSLVNNASANVDGVIPTFIAASSTPADNGSGVAPSANLQLVFSENLTVGTGNITLINVSTSATVETFNIATGVGSSGGTASLSGTTLTLNPNSNLDEATQYAIQIATTAFTDAVGNSFAGISDNTTYNFTTSVTDSSAPTFLAIQRDTPTTKDTNSATLTYTLHFNEAVTGVDASDFALNATGSAGGTITGVSGSGTSTITVTVGSVTGVGTLGLNLNNGHGITDIAGNALPTSEPADDEIYRIDRVAPTLISFNRLTSGDGITDSATVQFLAMFNEPVTGVSASDFTLATTGTATGSITGVSGDGTPVIIITVGSVSGNGTLNLDLAGGVTITDTFGNSLTNTSPTTTIDESYTIDKTAPTAVAITRTAAELTKATSVTFDVLFSETVANLDTTDFVLSGTATGTIASVNTTTGSAYTVTVNGISGNGALGLNFAGGQDIVDTAGNAFSGSAPSTNESYSIDNTAPTVTAINRAGVNQIAASTASSAVFTVVFNETVSGVATSDFTVTGTATGTSVTSVSSTNGKVFQVTVGGVNGSIGQTVGLDFTGSINDALNTAGSANFTSGQTYTIGGVLLNEGAVDQATLDVLIGVNRAGTLQLVHAEGIATELVIIDSRVPGLASLTNGIRAGVDVWLLDANSSAIDQITNILAQYHNLAAVHLISHGAAGAVYLGAETISSATLGNQAATLTAWGKALAETGDLLVYGCDVAAGETGQMFINALATATGADIAASDNLTGSNFLGGDWTLETTTGSVESETIQPVDFSGVLASSTTMYMADNSVESGIIYVRPNGTSYTWSFGTGWFRYTNNNPDEFLPIRTVSMNPNTPPPAGCYVQYSTNNGGSWTNLSTTEVSTSGTIWRYVNNTGTSDPYDFTFNYTVNNSAYISGTMYIGSWLRIIPDSAPTAINVSYPTTTSSTYLFTDTTQGTTLATLTPTDTGNIRRGYWAIDSGQTVSNLFAISSDNTSGNTATLTLGSGTMPAAGQTASVTVRYYDLYQTDTSNNPISGSGLSTSLTFNFVAESTQDLSGFGSDLALNTTTANAQTSPALTALSNGNFVAVWSSTGQSDGATKTSIIAQIFSSTGTKVGSEIVVSPANNNANEYYPTVAALDNGRFVVAYTSDTDADDLDIRYVLVAANGTVGSELVANTATDRMEDTLSIATLSDGSFMIGWYSYTSDYSSADSLARRFNAADGSPQGAEITLRAGSDFGDVNGSGLALYPSIAPLSNGSYVASWTQYDSSWNSMGVYGRVGTGTPFQITTSTDPYLTKLASLAGGGFVVTWDQGTDVYFRLYDNTGIAQGAAIRANVTTTGSQNTPAVVALSGGGFLVGWQSDTGDYSNSGIFGRRFAADGTAVDSTDIQINEHRRNDQSAVALAATSGNTFIAVWQDDAANGTGNSGIEGRLLLPTGPSVSSVTSTTANGIYKAGDIINVIVNFSEAVTVNTTNGTPYITLETGTTDRNVNYVSGSTTTALTFTYTVQAGDTSTDLDFASTTALVLNGGTINATTGGTAATLTLVTPGAANSLGNAKAIVIDTTAPSITNVTVPNSTMKVGNTVVVTITVSSDSDTYTLQSGSIDGFTLSSFAKINATTYTASFTVTEGGTDVAAGSNIPVSLVLLDTVGNQSSTYTTAIAQAGDAINANTPTDIALSNSTVLANAGANATVGAFSSTDSTSGDTFTYTLVAGTGSTNNASFSISGGNLLVTDPSAMSGTYSVRVRSTDAGGNYYEEALSVIVTSGPTVTDANIAITSTPSGTSSTYKIGDTVTATWNNTASGDNNAGVTGVTMDFTAFGGGAAIAATESSGIWSASYTIVSGSIDTTSRNVSVSATTASGTTTTADSSNLTVDNEAPTVTEGRISISGASGTAGAYKIGDTVTATWVNTAAGDNNTDTITTVTVDFSQFGGGSTVAASNSSGTWTATYLITAGAIDTTSRNVSITATDNAGNTTTTADLTNATVDSVAPIVTAGYIAISGASGTSGAFMIGDTITATWIDTGGDANADTIAGVTFNFSQFGGGTAVVASNSGGVWTATYTIVSGSINGTTNLNVSATVTDNAGNTTTAADTANVTLDNKVPTLSSSNPLDNATGVAITNNIVLTFDEEIQLGTSGTITLYDITGVGANSIVIDVANHNNQLTVSDTILTINPTLNLITTNQYAVQLAAGTVKDTIGNSFAGIANSTTLNFSTGSVDTTAPTAAIVDIADPTQPNAGTATINFSEQVTNVDITDFTLTRDGNAVTITGLTVDGSGSQYTLNLSSVTTTAGVYLLTLNTSNIQDTSGNPLTASVSDSFTIDTTAPTGVAIARASANPSNASSVNFTVTFSEAVSGVDSTDFTLTGTATSGATIGEVTQVSGAVYTVAVNNVSGNGMLGLDLNSSATGITDIAGNAISGGITGQLFTIDHTAPTVTAIHRNSAEVCNNGTVSYTVSFSEAVTGVNASDFTLDKVAGVTVTNGDSDISVTGSGDTYTVTVANVSGNGTLSVDLIASGTGISDASSNAIDSGFTNGDAYIIDTTNPSVTAAQSFNLPENMAANFVIGQVMSTDANAISGYIIASGDDAGYFAIDSNGVITLTTTGATTGAASADYETTPNSFNLGIIATDAAGNTSTSQTVIITVLDAMENASAPAVTTPTTISITDTTANDIFTSTNTSNLSGTISATDVDNIASYGISSPTSTSAAHTVNSITYDLSKTGTYGTLYMVSTGSDMGKYLFEPNNAVINALTNGTLSDTFTVTATDANANPLTENATLTVNVTGANDTPTVTSGSATATLVEAGGVANATTGTSVSSITLTKADVDGTASYDTAWLTTNDWTTADVGLTYTKTGTYGTATLTVATGVVSYALIDSDADTQALTSGQSVTDSFTIQVTDGSATQSVNASFAITG